jgi:hypothetical protein
VGVKLSSLEESGLDFVSCSKNKSSCKKCCYKRYYNYGKVFTSKSEANFFIHGVPNLKLMGYNGDFESINGAKIRRQYINIIIVFLFLFFSVLIFFLTVFALFYPIKNDLTPSFYFAVILINILVLGFRHFNKTSFGKIVAKVNEDGIYTRQYFIRWDIIEHWMYFVQGATSQFNGIMLYTKNTHYIIPNCPHYIIKYLKLYCKKNKN